MQKVLITGGAGFIGSNLCNRLYANGIEVVVLDCLSKQIHGDDPEKSDLYRSIKNKAEFICGNVGNIKDWEIAINDCDSIVHLAAETGTGQSMYNIEHYTNTNVNGTAKMWDSLLSLDHKVKKVIVASSRAIYGEGKYFCNEHGVVFPKTRDESTMSLGDFDVKCPYCNANVKLVPTSEDSLKNPISVYGLTKLMQEDLSIMMGASIGVPTIALRFQNVYGPGQSLKNPYTGILSIFSTRALNGNDIIVFEDGLESRDFVYIDDVIDAIILALDSDEANYKRLNVGSGVTTDVLTVANIIQQRFNTQSKVKVTGNFRIGDIRHNLADITDIQKLGYLPKVKFEDGMDRFLDWVESQTIEKDNYEQSINELRKSGLFK